jgi:hypothetical protein
MYRVIGSSGNLSNTKKKATPINKPTKKNNKKKIKIIDSSLFRLSNNLMLI